MRPFDPREWIRRLIDRKPGRFFHRAPSRPGSTSKQAELALLARQTRAAEASVVATIALTGALLFVAFLQWRTSESTAAIERAKAIPRFRINQTADGEVSDGFLAKSLLVVPTSGVSTATEATVRQIVLIHYHSARLKLDGICRASIENFYDFDSNLLQWSQSEAAQRLMMAGRQTSSDPSIHLQPVSTIIGVAFFDLYGRAGYQNLNFEAGAARPIQGDPRIIAGWSNINLLIQVDADANVLVFRQSDADTTQDCANALRVLQATPQVMVAKKYYFMSGGVVIFKNPGAFFEDVENSQINREYPAPRPFRDADPRRQSN